MSTVLNIRSSYFSENNIRYVFLDGRACSQIDDFYASLRQQLSLPDYFGNNLDALEEVLNDLDWIEEEKIKIIISNSSALLVNDSMKKESFLDILNSCDNEKLEIVYLDDMSNNT